MADNYLEKKYEALQQGRTVYRRNGPSLDALLRGVSEAGAEPDRSYLVKMAQLEAMVRSADLLGYGFRCECQESADGYGRIRVFPGKDVSEDGFAAGEYLLALRLKAAELGLRCRLVSDGGDQKTTPAVLVAEVFK